MVDCGATLDKSMTPQILANLARERLSTCTIPSGLIAERIDWNTKQPTLGTDYCNARSIFEIPTLLLRKEHDQNDFRLFLSITFEPEDKASSNMIKSGYREKTPVRTCKRKRE